MCNKYVNIFIYKYINIYSFIKFKKQVFFKKQGAEIETYVGRGWGWREATQGDQGEAR